MMSADELEKDLVKDLASSAKPKLNPSVDIANSSSAVSLANLSTRSVHGSEGDAENAEVESVVSNRVQPEDPAFVIGTGSGSSSPTLSKHQVTFSKNNYMVLLSSSPPYLISLRRTTCSWHNCIKRTPTRSTVDWSSSPIHQDDSDSRVQCYRLVKSPSLYFVDDGASPGSHLTYGCCVWV